MDSDCDWICYIHEHIRCLKGSAQFTWVGRGVVQVSRPFAKPGSVCAYFILAHTETASGHSA